MTINHSEEEPQIPYEENYSNISSGDVGGVFVGGVVLSLLIKSNQIKTGNKMLSIDG